jgi:hypothetical protein
MKIGAVLLDGADFPSTGCREGRWSVPQVSCGDGCALRVTANAIGSDERSWAVKVPPQAVAGGL